MRLKTTARSDVRSAIQNQSNSLEKIRALESAHISGYYFEPASHHRKTGDQPMTDLNPPASRTTTRRDVIKGTAISLASSAAWMSVPTKLHAAPETDHKYPALAPATADTVSAADDSPVVELTSGKIRGYQRRGIFTFKGIPYADTTAGSNRFLQPQKLKPWTGVRSSMQFGDVC